MALFFWKLYSNDIWYGGWIGRWGMVCTFSLVWLQRYCHHSWSSFSDIRVPFFFPIPYSGVFDIWYFVFSFAFSVLFVFTVRVSGFVSSFILSPRFHFPLLSIPISFSSVSLRLGYASILFLSIYYSVCCISFDFSLAIGFLGMQQFFCFSTCFLTFHFLKRPCLRLSKRLWSL